MKTKSLLLLPILFTIGCSNSQESSQKLLDTIFSNYYDHSIISQGDNLPDFDKRKDSIDLFIVALHENINPKKFQEKAGWTDEMLKEKIQLLIAKGWLIDDDKGLRPTIFIASDKQGIELYEHGKPLAEKIAQSIEKEISSIKEKFNTNGFSGNYNFESLSFLILSNVLLDNWQIMKMEKEYLKKENRPERHGKHYYCSIMENANYPKENFGIYGNQYGKINDSTYMSIYGNSRDIANKRLDSDPVFMDSVLNVAIKLTPELYNFFDEIAEDFKPKLLNILNEQTDYSHTVYEKTGYSDNQTNYSHTIYEKTRYSNKIKYEEFFIFWYHFIYTDATNILAKRNKLIIPEDGNFYYMH
jgi:hypothetical protein